MLSVSVIIPHYDQQDLLRKCLDGLLLQSYIGPQQVIVADNNTPGGIEEIVNRYPGVTFLQVEERGAACARNAALQVATGEVIAFTDSDCMPDRNWLAVGIEALAIDDTDIVGGAVQVTADDEKSLTSVEAFEKVFGFRQRQYVEQKNFSVTANIITRRDVVRETGCFTNGLSEDVDWCHRALVLGFRLSFYGKCIVSHPARRDWAALTQKWSRLIAERWRGHQNRYDRRLSGMMIWCLMALGTALSAVPHIVFVAISPALADKRDKLAALKILFRIRTWRCVRMLQMVLNDEDDIGEHNRGIGAKNDSAMQEV